MGSAVRGWSLASAVAAEAMADRMADRRTPGYWLATLRAAGRAKEVRAFP